MSLLGVPRLKSPTLPDPEIHVILKAMCCNAAFLLRGIVFLDEASPDSVVKRGQQTEEAVLSIGVEISMLRD